MSDFVRLGDSDLELAPGPVAELGVEGALAVFLEDEPPAVRARYRAALARWSRSALAPARRQRAGRAPRRAARRARPVATLAPPSDVPPASGNRRDLP